MLTSCFALDGLIFLFYGAFHVIASLLLVGSAVGITGALVIVLFALVRRILSLWWGSRLRDVHEDQSFVLE
jgi:hypothetical protein